MLRRRFRRRRTGEFQPYSHTYPDRYPWLFRQATELVRDGRDTRLLSFGCSHGDEAFSLRRYFPLSKIKGIDINPRNIGRARATARKSEIDDIEFEVAASTATETVASYDAIFCLSVLCHGDLASSSAARSDPQLRFEDFERVIADFARCLKVGGVLFLHSASFRLCQTDVAAEFDIVLEAAREEMGPDRQFGRDNRAIAGERCRAVAFRKKSATSRRFIGCSLPCAMHEREFARE